MQRTPRELVLELYRLWNEDGIDAALAHVSPDIEWIEPKEAIGRDSARGIDDARENYESWIGAYENYSGEIANIEDHGDRVLVHFIQRGSPRGGSVAVEEPVYQLWTVRAGLAARMQMFFDVEEARAALHE